LHRPLDVLAAKLFSGKHCLLLRDRLDAAREGMAQFYMQVSPGQRGPWDFETDIGLLAAHEERPTQRHSKRSGTARWWMNDESMGRYLVTMLVLIHAIPLVDMPILANVLGSIPLDFFFSCWRRLSHLDYHFANMMSRLHLALLTTWLRTFLGGVRT
jgi:hypothetical protein